MSVDRLVLSVGILPIVLIRKCCISQLTQPGRLVVSVDRLVLLVCILPIVLNVVLLGSVVHYS